MDSVAMSGSLVTETTEKSGARICCRDK